MPSYSVMPSSPLSVTVLARRVLSCAIFVPGVEPDAVGGVPGDEVLAHLVSAAAVELDALVVAGDAVAMHRVGGAALQLDAELPPSTMFR